MNQLLQQATSFFILLPLLAFFASLPWKNRDEKAIVLIVLLTKLFYLLAALGFAVVWFIDGGSTIVTRFLTIYQTDNFVFAIDFYYDRITAVYSIVGAILFFLVATFSRFYMHRDEGFKRFFNTILFFAFGYNLIIFSGNFETLFIGWEVIGISSFLLIAFYRNRYLPVKNAFKVLSNYRLSDVALILVMWMMHHLTHQNISFTQLAEAKAIASQESHTGMAVFIVIMLVIAALVKSAQAPFTSWLPRAMEGPTTSSAIFYGSLSVHIGVFILLRTFPFWQDMLWAKVVIIALGALTAILATNIARVQPTVKTQIAYASAAQIGIIFIEVAMGWHVLALIHFAGNAFLRTYQLLVSPSVLNYLVHQQYFHYKPPQQRPVAGWKAGVYILAIKELNLDAWMQRYVWNPFKWLGRQAHFFHSSAIIYLTALTGLVFLALTIIQPELFSATSVTGSAFLFVALALVLFTFSYRGPALKAWTAILITHVFIITGISVASGGIKDIELVLYGSGVVVSYFLGLYCLTTINRIDGDIVLNKYHGYVYEQKGFGILFMLAAIGMLGFPVTAAFIGIDVLFTYVNDTQVVMITLLALCMIFIELAAVRIFIRIFLGPHKKLDHPVAFRSS
ncbi:MAG TPA: proton-conducting transporter membrane subunit [Chitinophagaceae bacterium]|nr:proton-conducting transporter membrane subunit [Chitinophagaceae bacterium]